MIENERRRGKSPRICALPAMRAFASGSAKTACRAEGVPPDTGVRIPLRFLGRGDACMPELAPQLDEIRGLLAHLPGPDLDSGTAAALRERQLTKPAGALGRLEELAGWLATWQGRYPPSLRHPRTVVFAGNHGVASRGVSAYPPAVTAQMVQNFMAGGASVNQLCKLID